MILCFYKTYFPKAMSYSRFIHCLPRTLVPLYCYLYSMKGAKNQCYFIDSTYLPVCHNKRIYHHKTFKGMAKRGFTSVGYFFGFKLHMIVNAIGEIISFTLTPGNVSDTSSVLSLTKGLFGKLFGDKGYLSSSLFKTLLKKGLHLVTKIRNNMKNKLIDLQDKFFLKRRGFIESIIGQLKSKYLIHHTRYRSRWGSVVNLLGGLLAYTLNPKKPKPRLRQKCLLPIEP